MVIPACAAPLRAVARRAKPSSQARRQVRRLATLVEAHPQATGTSQHGFTLLRKQRNDQLQLTAYHLTHDKTGAEYIHIERADDNNVFSIGFKTNPPDDTGVPHILEHTTLCGSKKYPIRDPFFKMMPRTLSNFMNAFTSSDHTSYPFATTNAQDFRNLMSVYLDATLNPLLKETDFTQEGWRIGPENPQALVANGGKDATPEDKKLVFKGVVYNEMKGQMSDAGYLYYIRFQDHVFPAINNSGGDPQKMTELTWNHLRRFHAEHYHPSNARLFTYGNMPLADHLTELDAQLAAFEKIQRDGENKRPIDMSAGPQEVTVQGPLDPLVDATKQYKTSTAWITGDTSDVTESFAVALISALLMDGYGSPLYKGLIESGLGTDWSPNTGYDSSNIVGIYSVGLTGVQEADVPKVKTEVQRLLREARDKGFQQSKIDGYLHQIELGLKHKTANFGMSMMNRLMPKWFLGGDPFRELDWEKTLADFKSRLSQGGYLEGLMDKYLLNDNTLTFTMTPSATFGQDLAEEESSRLAVKIADAVKAFGGDDAAAKELEKQELILLEEQAKTITEDLSCLPSVHVEDIPRQKKPAILRDDLEDGVSTQWYEAPTNGLTYFRAINTFQNLPDDLRELLPLFSGAIMRLGTKTHTMEELEDLIKLKTGGVSVGYHNTSSPTDHTKASEGLIFTGMAFDGNVPVMFDLLLQLVAETNFDSPSAPLQIREIIRSSADGVVNDIASSGHAYARRAAEAGLSRNGLLKEQVSGLTQVKLITDLASRPESDQLEDIIAKLKAIQQLAMTPGNLRAAITCGTEAVADNKTALTRFLSSFTSQAPSTLSSSFPATLQRNLKTFFPLPYQVYYGALVLPTTSYTSPQTAPLQILSQLLTHKHLHHEIREKGGAYGGGAYSRSLDGIFGFYSYRDPNPQNTLKIMRSAGQWAVDKKFTDRDMEDAKISVFQSVDAPKSVNEEGMGRFLYGIEEGMRAQMRERLLDVKKEDVREVAQKYLVEALGGEQERTVFLGEKKPWVDGGWTVKEMNVGAGIAEDVD